MFARDNVASRRSPKSRNAADAGARWFPEELTTQTQVLRRLPSASIDSAASANRGDAFSLVPISSAKFSSAKPVTTATTRVGFWSWARTAGRPYTPFSFPVSSPTEISYHNPRIATFQNYSSQ
ncbi:unnamed protein product [Linum trigynum]|uniref:Uncharacterized protein n=1 Tax=Linum trigynum TaxID=586398 RepID=A0AAV2GWM7_9ROSI